MCFIIQKTLHVLKKSNSLLCSSKAINISTTYRVLDLLVDLGFAKSLENATGKRLFAPSHSLEEHALLVCNHCG